MEKHTRKVDYIAFNNIRFFEQLLKEEVTAGDFSEFVPENVRDESKDKDDAKASTC